MDDQAAIRLAQLADGVRSFAPALASQETITIVQKALRENAVTLVIGAGASTALKLPVWDKLVEDLFRDVYLEINPSLDTDGMISTLRVRGYSSSMLIRHLECVVGYSSSVREMLRHRLYVGFQEAGAVELLEPISRMFLCENAPAPVDRVITYNFDNALERTLARCGVQFSVAFSDKSYSTMGSGVQIYHPHGYLPHSEDDMEDQALEHPVVFSEQDYNLHYMDLGHWANIAQLESFLHRTCFFIGFSFIDPSVRRLMDHAHKRTGPDIRHVSILRTKGNALAEQFIEEDLRSLGVQPLWARDLQHIPHLIELCASI